MDAYPLPERHHQLPTVYQWLRRMKLVKPKGNKDYSHRAFDSFIFNGPIDLRDVDLLDAFYRKYAVDWKAHEDGKSAPLYIDETCNQMAIFPLCFDLDVYIVKAADTKAIDEDAAMDRPLHVICESIRTCFGLGETDRSWFVVTTGGVTESEKSGKPVWKLGYHLVSYGPGAFDGLKSEGTIFVDKDTLCKVRVYCIQQLNEALGREWDGFQLQNYWDDVIDLQRCKFAAQRLVGSRKMQHCSECKTKYRKGDASGCGVAIHFKSHFDVGRPHRLYHAYRLGGMVDIKEEQRLRDDYLLQLRALCIRKIPPAGGVTPLAIKIDDDEDGLNKLLLSKKIGKVTPCADQVIRTLVQLYFKEEIKAIKYDKGLQCYTVQLHGTYCINKLGDHTTSTGYILMSKATGLMSRRCYSRKEQSHIHGPCSEFQSAMPIPPRCFLPLFKCSTDLIKAKPEPLPLPEPESLMTRKRTISIEEECDDLLARIHKRHKIVK